VEVTKNGTEVQTVGVSRILQYVSPSELERFENEQFRVEAEAQAIADREEEEEQIRRRMAKNARAIRNGREGVGRGRGSHMLNGLAIDSELPTRTRGQGRGRPRGKIGRRGRGGRGGRGGLALSRALPEEETVNGESSLTLATSHEDTTETSSEEEERPPQLASPNLMRSALVANSALPLSPVRPMPPPALQRGHPEVPDIGGTASASGDSESSDSEDEDGHRSKRRRTESVTLQRPHQASSSSSQDDESGSGEDSIPPDLPSSVKAHEFQQDHTTPRAGHSMLQKPAFDADEAGEDSEDDEDAEEYVVEAIIEHYHDEEGRKFYLVKWEGYEDSHDWLPEEDLEGAAELVHDYNERVKRKEKNGSRLQ
jgi:hypothetical protein